MLESEINEELSYLEELLIEGRNIQFIVEKSQSLLGLVDSQENASLYCSILLINGKALYFLGNIDRAKSIFESILNDNYTLENIVYAKALIALANIHQKNAEFAESIDCCLRAVTIFELEKNSSGLALAFTNIGITYRILADYSKSLEFMDKGRRLYEELGDELGVAANTGNIGNVYFGLNQYSKALEYQVLALNINEKLNNLRGIANNCLTIGGVYLLTKEYDLADLYLHRAKDVYRIMEDKAGEMHAQSNIGILLEFQENFEKAHALHELVLEYSIEKGDQTGIASQFVNIGNLYANLSNTRYDPRQAEEYFNKAMELHSLLNLKQEECTLHKQMSELYSQMNLWEKALYHLNKHLELNQKLLSEDAQNKADLYDQRRRLEIIERDRLLQVARYQEQEKILHNILPNSVANRILDGETSIVDFAEDVSIFFSDIADFTAMTSSMEPERLIHDLNILFTEFDRIAKKHNVEKIKTIGDAYMAVCGVPIKHENHALKLANFAFDVMKISEQCKIGNNFVKLRIGIHTGEAIAGVIGEDKYSYDLWGDAVNIASRMENSSETGKIQVTEQFKQLLEHQSHILFVSRGNIEIKGKGLMQTYFMHQINSS